MPKENPKIKKKAILLAKGKLIGESKTQKESDPIGSS
jgi:hypothetical protein